MANLELNFRFYYFVYFQYSTRSCELRVVISGFFFRLIKIKIDNSTPLAPCLSFSSFILFNFSLSTQSVLFPICILVLTIKGCHHSTIFYFVLSTAYYDSHSSSFPLLPPNTFHLIFNLSKLGTILKESPPLHPFHSFLPFPPLPLQFPFPHPPKNPFPVPPGPVLPFSSSAFDNLAPLPAPLPPLPAPPPPHPPNAIRTCSSP